jgi:hypothetical protein
MRRTKASLIYRRTNLRAVQPLLGHTKLESTVRYLGIEVDDALELTEQTKVWLGVALTAPAAPAARRRAVLRQPHTSYSLYAGRDFVEVLTKCRVQHLSHGDVRFVDARRY